MKFRSDSQENVGRKFSRKTTLRPRSLALCKIHPLSAVLAGRKDWDKLYSENVGTFETHDQNPEPQWFVDLVTGERSAFDKLWKGNYSAAAKEYASIAEDSEARDARLSAWYRHWEGLAHSLARDHIAAARAYLHAANERSELGRPAIKQGLVVSGGELKPSPQAVRIAQLMEKKGQKANKEIAQIKKELTYGPATNVTEEALRKLGEFIGLVASRPEEDFDTGPDVLWYSPDHKAGAVLEAKTDKKDSTQYRKKEDIGQFYDHVEWIEKKYPKDQFYKIIVGKKHRVSEDANPPEDLRIITLEQFQLLANRVGELFDYVNSVAKSSDLAICVERGLQLYGLAWPKCIDSLESSLAIDLKAAEPPQAVTGD